MQTRVGLSLASISNCDEDCFYSLLSGRSNGTTRALRCSAGFQEKSVWTASLRGYLCLLELWEHSTFWISVGRSGDLIQPFQGLKWISSELMFHNWRFGPPVAKKPTKFRDPDVGVSEKEEIPTPSPQDDVTSCFRPWARLKWLRNESVLAKTSSKLQNRAFYGLKRFMELVNIFLAIFGTLFVGCKIVLALDLHSNLEALLV